MPSRAEDELRSFASLRMTAEAGKALRSREPARLGRRALLGGRRKEFLWHSKFGEKLGLV
jgi:hypothetical protein